MLSTPLILIIYIYSPSYNIATFDGSISTNGTIQGSWGGGRGRALFNLTTIGVPVGYSGTDNHLTCATWILSNDKNRITHAYKDLPPLTKVTTELHLFIFSFNFLTPVIGWSDVNSTPQIFARVCTVHNLTSTSAPLYSWRVKSFNKPLTYVFESSYVLLLWQSKQRVSRLIGGGECTGLVARKYSEYTRAIDASQCFLCFAMSFTVCKQMQWYWYLNQGVEFDMKLKWVYLVSSLISKHPLPRQRSQQINASRVVHHLVKMRFMRARGRSLCELGQSLRNFQLGHLEITLEYVIETCSVPVWCMWYESTRDTLISIHYPPSYTNIPLVTSKPLRHNSVN